MFKLLGKNHLSAAIALLTIGTASSLLANNEYYYYGADNYCCSPCNRVYIGAFGGELFSNTPEIRQTGVAFFSEITPPAIGPLAIDARGASDKTSPGFGGVQLGYEWTQSPFYMGCSDWAVTTAVEAEAFFYSETRNANDMFNLGSPGILQEHDFNDSFNVRAGVYVANAVFKLNNPCFCRFAPYLGVGIGAAHLSARNADSLQERPLEPGVNHFNSKRNDSAWTLAVQAKAGIQYLFTECLRLFVEYRYVSIDPSLYNFGSTIAPPHVPTTTWDVTVARTAYNGFAIGFQYDL